MIKRLNLQNNVLPLLAIIALGVICYANSFRNEFVWDDYWLIVENPSIRNLASIPQILVSNLSEGSGEKNLFYRPLQEISYAIDYFFWKNNVFGYHLTNTLCHIANTFLIYLILSMLIGEKTTALIASLIFAAHPIHTEAVTYIAGRADLLAAFFIFLSFYLYMKAAGQKRIYFIIFSLGSFALSLLSKEVSLVFPLVLIVYELSHNKGEKNLFQPLPFILLTALYIIVRLNAHKIASGFATANISLPVRLLTMTNVILLYLKLLILPFPLHMERNVFAIETIMAKEPILFLAIFIISILILRRSKIMLFLFAWFFINLLPVLNIFQLNAAMAEHWLYISSMGFFGILAISIYGAADRLKVQDEVKLSFLTGITLVILIYFVALTIKQNTTWLNEEAIYRHTVKYADFSARAHSNVGKMYFIRGDYERALAESLKSKEIDPRNPEVYNNMGLIYAATNRRDDAVAAYNKALELDPNFLQAYINLGKLYKEEGALDTAVSYFEKALLVNPKSTNALFNLFLTYDLKGDKKKADEISSTVLSIDPAFSDNMADLGFYYLDKKRYKEAIGAFEKVLVGASVKDPSLIYNNLAICYQKIGKPYKAIELLRKAIELKKDNKSAFFNLGLIYQEMKNDEEALKAFEASERLSPDNADVHIKMGLSLINIGRVEEALKEFREAEKLNSRDPYIYRLLGNVYYMQKNYKGALKEWEHSLELDPKNDSLKNNVIALRQLMQKPVSQK